jgi:membrane-bound lytic murein transglycosylase MltF
MVKRRLVRVLAVQSPVLYFVDKGRELGLTYENAKAFENQLNESLGTGNVRIHVLLMPVARDELIPRLLAGQGDIAAATLTITPERLKQVDFSEPLARGVTEILVTGPSSTPVATLHDLSGKEVHVRASGSEPKICAAATGTARPRTAARMPTRLALGFFIVSFLFAARWFSFGAEDVAPRRLPRPLDLSPIDRMDLGH